MAVRADRFQGAQGGAVADLGRAQAPEGLFALAGERDGGARDFALEAAAQGLGGAGNGPAAGRGEALEGAVAESEGRSLGAQVVGLESLPGGRIAFRRSDAAEMAGREGGSPEVAGILDEAGAGALAVVGVAKGGGGPGRIGGGAFERRR